MLNILNVLTPYVCSTVFTFLNLKVRRRFNLKGLSGSSPQRLAFITLISQHSRSFLRNSGAKEQALEMICILLVAGHGTVLETQIKVKI